MGLWLNVVTTGFFWAMALLGFCVICFFATIRLQVPRAFGFAGFIGLIGAIWLATLKYLSWSIASMFIITGLIGLAVLVMQGK